MGREVAGGREVPSLGILIELFSSVTGDQLYFSGICEPGATITEVFSFHRELPRVILRQLCSNGRREDHTQRSALGSPTPLPLSAAPCPPPRLEMRGAPSPELEREETAGTQRVPDGPLSLPGHHLLRPRSQVGTSSQRLPAAPPAPASWRGPGCGEQGGSALPGGALAPEASPREGPGPGAGAHIPQRGRPLAGLSASASPWFLQSPAGLPGAGWACRRSPCMPAPQGSSPPPLRGSGS